MEIKNSQILLIESSLNELHKTISEKDLKNLQLQKEKEYLKDTILNNKYELESIVDENEKLKKQIKILFEKQNDLKDEIRDKEMDVKSMEHSKRQAEKLIQSKNDSFISSIEERLFDSNEDNKESINKIKELQNNNKYLKDVIDINTSDIDSLQYDNNNLKKQIKVLKESINHQDNKLEQEQYEHQRRSQQKTFQDSNNVMLKHLEQKLLESQQPVKEKKDITNRIRGLSEEEILKNSLGL